METNAKLLALVLCALQFYKTGTYVSLSKCIMHGAMELLQDTLLYGVLAM